MDRKIRVGAVSYLNTKPLIYGLEKGMMKEEIELVLDYPAHIAQKLIADEIDLGLVPVAVIPQLKYHRIIGDYGICCDGPVASVCLFSQVPLEEITEVLLDYQSRTSVRLAKILLKEYWKLTPKLTDTTDDFRDQIKDSVAGVVIGDRALEQRHKSKFIYDLGAAWKDFIGTPFVFAAWISNKDLPPGFEKLFNSANLYGLERIQEVISKNPSAYYDLTTYYSRNIQYELNPAAMAGLNSYLEFLNKLNML